MYIYIYLICLLPLIWKEFCRNVFRPVRQSGIPVRSTGILAKAGEFLSYKHSVPLCRDDIMLTLQIVPGEIVPGINIDIQQLLLIRQVRFHQFKTFISLDYWSVFFFGGKYKLKSVREDCLNNILTEKNTSTGFLYLLYIQVIFVSCD